MNSQKKYGLIWDEENSKEEFEINSENKIPVLVEDKDKEIITDSTKPTNILIEGENYFALKILNQEHQNKIDVIYIDPPYNTGRNNLKYKDKLINNDGNFRHSRWISFMNKRLRIAKDLLKDDGVIFISIDDNELAQLKLLCDEIFGEHNLIAIFPRKSTSSPKNNSKLIAKQNDYVICYAKNIKQLKMNKKNTTNFKNYKYEDEFVETRGKFGLEKLDRGSLGYSKSMFYPIETPDKNLIFPGGGKPGREKWNWRWRWSKEKVKWGIENKFIIFKKTKEGWFVYSKDYQFVNNKNEPIKRQSPFKTVIENFFNEKGNRELENIFHKHIFKYPKPVGLIKFLINLHKNKNGIVLDFFAGSGTTGHAVLELNKEDGGNRQFILCTNNENNICTEICYPRLQKVINGYETPRGKFIEGLGGNLKYYKIDYIKNEK